PPVCGTRRPRESPAVAGTGTGYREGARDSALRHACREAAWSSLYPGWATGRRPYAPGAIVRSFASVRDGSSKRAFRAVFRRGISDGGSVRGSQGLGFAGVVTCAEYRESARRGAGAPPAGRERGDRRSGGSTRGGEVLSASARARRRVGQTAACRPL